MGIGPFFKPILQELGMSRTILSVAVALGMLIYGIGMPLAGYLVDRYSTRFVLLLGVFVTAVSIVWTVTADSVISFFIAYGVLFSLGLSFTSPVALTPVISRWFTRRRGMALFYLSTGSMAGIAIMTPIFSLCIAWVGWQNTLLWFMAVFAVITIPTAIYVIRDEAPEGTDEKTLTGVGGIGNQDQPSVEATSKGDHHMAVGNQLLGWRDALKSRSFWQIAFGLFVCGYSMNLLGAHGVPMLTDHGFPPTTASFGIGLIGLTAIVSTIFLGRLSDRLPRTNILFWIYLIRGLGFLTLVAVTTKWQLYLAAVIGGMVWAGSISLSSAILGDLFGVRLVGILYGWTYFGHQVGATISSFLGGWGYEVFNTHLISFGSAGILLLSASWISLRMRVPAPRLPAQQTVTSGR